MRKQKIIHRTSFGQYVLDEIMGANDQRRADKQKELKILEKSRPANSVECSECGKIGIIARCHHKNIFGRCDKPLCKKCVVKIDGKYYCEKHT